MGQGWVANEKMRNLLLALSCRDLKRAMSGVQGTLEVFSQETGKTPAQSLEAMKVADYIANMQFAATNLMDNLDGLLDTLSHVCPEVESIVEDAGRLEEEGGGQGAESCVAVQEERLRELSSVPPHILHM